MTENPIGYDLDQMAQPGDPVPPYPSRPVAVLPPAQAELLPATPAEVEALAGAFRLAKLEFQEADVEYERAKEDRKQAEIALKRATYEWGRAKWGARWSVR